MARHIITIPDRMFGRELRTIIWDDEAGTVEGDHFDIKNFQRVFDAPKPVTVGSQGNEWHLHDPAHNPAEFLTYLGVIFWPALREPLRSTLPPVFDGVEIVRSAWADITFDPNAIY